MGLWSEWHYTTREIGGWIHNHERVARVIMYPYTNPRVVLCHSDHRPNAFSLLYHTFWCKFTHQHINLKSIYNVTLKSDCLSLALYDNGCSGVLNREHAQRLHVLPSPLLRHLQNAWAKSKRSIEMKSWTVTCDICVNMASKQAKIEFLSHISTIYSTPRCRAQWQTYPEAPTSHLLNRRVGIHGLSGFEFAVVGQLCTQNWCHACMPVYKCTYPCTTHSKPQASGKPNRCGSVLLDRKDPTCFSILQK